MTATARRWGFAVLAGSALLAVGAWLLATRSLRREAMRRAAGSVAGYLSVSVPRERAPDPGYRLPVLISVAHVLERLPGWSGRLQVYHGRTALLEPARDSLPARVLDRLGRADVPIPHRGGFLAPLKDPDDWDVVGAVLVRGERSPARGAASWGWAAALVFASLLLGYAGMRERRLALSLAGAGVLVLGGHLLVRHAARAATDAWLLDARSLVEQAVWTQPADPDRLSRIARGGDAAVRIEETPLVPARVRDGRVPRAVVGVRLPSRQILSLVAVPGEATIGWWDLLLLLAAALGPAGVAAVRWVDRARGRRAQFRETLTAWGFLAPATLHLAVFSFAPILFAVYLSVHHWSPLEPVQPFAGLANYGAMLRDGLFWTSLRNTVLYSLYVPVTAAVALALALAVNRRFRGVRVLRTVFFLPFISSVVAVALVWQWMYHPDYGLINYALARIGWRPVDWLGSPRTALLAVMILSVWVHIGYQMVVFLAGLQGIPQIYLDAARVDGANAWQRFRYVIFPLLKPVTLFVLVTGVIGSFQVFTYIYVMTEGGPLHATDVVVFRIYQTAWEFLQFGYASAMSLVLFVVLLGVTLAQFRLLGRQVEYA